GDRNPEATVYVGNLDEKVTDELLFELMLQAGPLVNVYIPKDRVMGSHGGFGFCEFLTAGDAEYAVKIMHGIKLFGKPIRVNKASADKKQEGIATSIGAELFIGNLDPLVDARTLLDTFSAFGQLLQPPTVTQQAETGKRYGFVTLATFDAADAAIAGMHNQFLMNQCVTVQYAYKENGTAGGQRHGDKAERLLAEQAKKNNIQLVPVEQPLALPAGFTTAAMGGFVPPPPP
ncbi:hypothetical protein BCR37DRAFT_335935, partial [Protomyces lactucae-debilis]